MAPILSLLASQGLSLLSSAIQAKGKEVVLVDGLSVSASFLEDKLKTDNATYGWIDYPLFGLRPLFHLFGKSTRNAGARRRFDDVHSKYLHDFVGG